MNITNNKGTLYSIDLLFAFLIGVTIILLITSNYFNELNKTVNNSKLFELKKNSFTITDSIITNRNTENPLLGASEYNSLKHRIEENKLDLELLKTINPDSNLIKELKVKLIKIIFKNNEEKTILEKKLTTNCFGTNRFVLIGKEKAKLNIVICNE